MLGDAPRIAVEAGSPQGWHRWTGPDGAIIALDRFGASAPADQLYTKFGITASAVANAARTAIARSTKK